MSDGSRLLEDVTAAFVDRRPIDWAALLSRTQRCADRGLFENLSVVAAVRGAVRSTTSAESSDHAFQHLRLLIAVALLQISWYFAISSTALLEGVGNPDRSPQMVLAVTFAVAIIPLGLASRSDSRSLCLTAFFACASSVFARAASRGLSIEWLPLMDRVGRGICLEAFLPACLWQFALDFPHVNRFTSFDVVARRATVTAWLLGLLNFGINVFAALDLIDRHTVAPFLNSDTNNIYWYLLVATFVPATAAIFIRSRRAPVWERRKVVRLAAALTFGLAPFLVLGPIVTAFPVVNDWSIGAGPRIGIWLESVVLTALAAMPILIGLAVITDRPFGLGDAFGRKSPPRVATNLLSALTQRFVHRNNDEQAQLGRSLDQLRNARGGREALEILARELRKTISVKSVRALALNSNDTFVDAASHVTSLPAKSVLVAMLQEVSPALEVSPDKPLTSLLPLADRTWVTENNIRLLAPVKTRDGSIPAVIILGPKTGGFPFERRDKWLLATLTAAAGAGWDTGGRQKRREGQTKRLEAAYECPACGRVSPTTPLTCPCHAVPILASLPSLLGGKFIIERRLGKGGMGVVYLARDRTLDRPVALKTLPELHRGAVNRLRDEARAMAALNHEALATIYGLEVWRRTPVLVVEFFPEGTLAQRLTRGPLSTADAIRLGIRLSAALEYMHARGVLHRDLKPRNIAFSRGEAKLLDFGLTTLIERREELDDIAGSPAPSLDHPANPGARQSGSAAAADASAADSVQDDIVHDSVERREMRFAGTLAYQPPEGRRGDSPSPAFDLWALAVTLIESITEVNPFASTSRPRNSRPLGPLQPELAPPIHAFFERALAPLPEGRFETASEFHSSLQAVGLEMDQLEKAAHQPRLGRNIEVT